MLAIVISACLMSDPGVCRDYRISLDVAVDQLHCAAQAPPYFAKWAEEHPGWTITRWKCTSASSSDT